MKEALLSTMLIACMAAAGTSTVFAQTPHPRTGKVSPAETEVRRANAEEVDAFLQNDPKAMDRLWSEDFVVTNPLNKFVTKQQVLGMVHAGVLVITSSDRQIEYLRVYGDAVIVAARQYRSAVTVSRTNSTSATRLLATVAFGRNPALRSRDPTHTARTAAPTRRRHRAKAGLPRNVVLEVPNHTCTHPRDFASSIGAAVSALPIPRLQSVGVTLTSLIHSRGALSG
jgi:Domain of unknown function (DUF4440)